MSHLDTKPTPYPWYIKALAVAVIAACGLGVWVMKGWE